MEITPELITAIFSGIAAVLTPICLVLVARMGRKIDKVEKQGNSRHVEELRLVMVMAERLVLADSSAKNVQLSNDAIKAYEEAVKANARL